MKYIAALACCAQLAGCIYVVQLPEVKAPKEDPVIYTALVRYEKSRETSTLYFSTLVQCEAALATLPKNARLIEKCYPK